MKHSYHVVLRKWCFYIAIVALNSTANEVFASSICHYYIGYDLSTATIVCTSGFRPQMAIEYILSINTLMQP